MSFFVLIKNNNNSDRIQHNLGVSQFHSDHHIHEEPPPPIGPLNNPPVVALANPVNPQELWRRVLSAKHIPGSQSSSEDEDDLETSVTSQPDSDDDAQPTEEDEIRYNPATYGLTPEMLIRERSSVQQVLNGVLFSSVN